MSARAVSLPEWASAPTLPFGREDILVVVLRGQPDEASEARLLRWQARLAAALRSAWAGGASVQLVVLGPLDAAGRAWLAAATVIARGLGVDLRVVRPGEPDA